MIGISLGTVPIGPDPGRLALVRGRALNRISSPVLALVVLAALLRFWRIGHQGFWYDEADTALLLHYSPGAMLGLLPSTESTPPVYYCLAWVWAHLFGDSEAPLRALSALAGTGVVATLAAAGRRLTGDARTGLIAAALAACNPLLIWYSQEARAYELLVLASALAWWCFAAASEHGDGHWLAAWSLVCGLALATHYYAIIVIVPQATVLIWRWRARRPAWLAVGAVVAVGCALLVLLEAQSRTGNDAWIAHIPFGQRVGEVIPQFLIGTGAPARTPALVIAAVAAFVGLIALAWWRPRGAPLVGAMTLAGFVLALIFSAGLSDTLLTRNLIDLWPGAAVTIAGGLACLSDRRRASRPQATRVGPEPEPEPAPEPEPEPAPEPAPTPRRARRRPVTRPGRWLAPLCVGALCAVGVWVTVGVDTTYALQRPDWRPLAALLERRDPGANRLILIQHYGDDLPLALYMPKLGWARAARERDVAEIDIVAIGPEPPPGAACWWGAGCNLSPTRLQHRYRIPGFRTAGVSHVEQFSVLSLRAARPRGVTRAELAAALVSTTLGRDVLLLQRRS